MEALLERRQRLLASDAAMENLPVLSEAEIKVDAKLAALKARTLEQYSLLDFIQFWDILDLIKDLFNAERFFTSLSCGGSG
jgi:hypothetical protein